ncbi:MAG TPA: arginyltransferase [Nannocystaceae bacterium]|nr:arginyltransferase [Nannocystaceae bacterium]
MSQRPRMMAGEPPELVVHDEPMACPYLPGREARLPMRLPTRWLRPSEFDARLRIGDRRQGVLLYRTACVECEACQPIRIDVHAFCPGRTQRRIHARGREVIGVELGPPEFSQERLGLYNRHKQGRGLATQDAPMDEAGYRAFLVDTCCDTFEIRYRVAGQLIGVAIVDRAQTSLSAVYTYYDPLFEALSPGVFSILTQIDLCRRWGLRHLYLGFYVEDCAQMAYKSRYLPHERRIDGVWQVFDRGR